MTEKIDLGIRLDSVNTVVETKKPQATETNRWIMHHGKVIAFVSIAVTITLLIGYLIGDRSIHIHLW